MGTLRSTQNTTWGMTVKYSSERTIEAIIESVIKQSLADQSERHILDRGQRQDQEDNEGNNCSDGQMLELSREISSLLSEFEAMEARLRLSPPARSTSRRTREPFAWRFQGSGRTLEQQRKVEAGLERSRRRRLSRARDVIAAGNIIGELSQRRGESQEKTDQEERIGEGSHVQI